MNKHAEYTRDRLETIRRTRSRLRAAAIALNTSAVLLACWLAAAMMDYWLMLPFGWRLGVATVLAGVIVFGVHRLIGWWRRPVSLKQIALELEAARPDLGCLVSTTAEQTEGESGKAGDYASELRASLQEHTARRLIQVEADWYHREVKRSACGFGAAATLALAFLLAAPAGNLAFLRSLAPWSDATYTRVMVQPGDIELPIGENLSISAEFIGRLPRDSSLEWRRANGGQWHAVAMARDDAGRAHGILEEVREDLVYRVSAARARSDEFRIHAYVPPSINDLAIDVQYPEYTGLEPRNWKQPNLSVVRGSRLQWTIDSSGDIAKARMRFASLPGFELKPAGSNIWTAGFTPKQDLYYWIDLLDRNERRGGNRQPHQVAVVPDEKPEAEIVEPGGDIRADPFESVPVEVDVSDDFGVSEAAVVVRKMDGTERTLPLELSEPGTREARLHGIIQLAAFDLKPYELLSYHVEVRDNNTLDGPGVGKSPTYFIEYTNREKALSQCQGAADKVNLLVAQKQIIASTIAITPDDSRDVLADLAAVQRLTRDYAVIFGDSYQLNLAPPEPRAEFDGALEAMEASAAALDSMKAGDALPHQERALQHLYQLARLMPECEGGLCRGEGNSFKVYLQAIERLKEAQDQEVEATVKTALARTRELHRDQSELVNQFRREVREAAPAGKDGTPNDANGAAPANNGTGTEAGEQDTAGELSDAQRQIAERAAELARLLEKLAGKDPRISHRHGSRIDDVAGSLQQAAGRAGRGDFEGAGAIGGSNISVIGEVVFALEQFYEPATVSADLAGESYPKAFEARINSYLRALSHAE